MQLAHDEEETSWEAHGWVSLSLGGVELARDERCQHNRHMRQSAAVFEKMAAALPDPAEEPAKATTATTVAAVAATA